MKEIPRGDRISPKAPTEDSGPSKQREGPQEAAAATAARPHQQKGQRDPAGDPIPIIPEQLVLEPG